MRLRTRHRRPLLGPLLLAGVLATGCRSQPATSTAPAPVVEPNATIVAVADGDTIVVRVAGERETVRLIGIDAPETHHPTKPVQCYGPEAATALEELLPPGTRVRLERDAEPRDRYGRLLAYVHRSDGLFVNLELARRGLVDVLSIAPNTAYADPLRVAVAEARRERRGLWGACPSFGAPA